jgi:hypothetical protein
MENETEEKVGMPLIFDEIEGVPSKNGNEYPFRIRVWRTADRAPVVLVSQAEGGPPPAWMMNRLLNHVYGGVLGYPERGMRYFMDHREIGDRALFQVFFELIGHHQRARACRPIEKLRPWEYLAAIVGQAVEH